MRLFDFRRKSVGSEAFDLRSYLTGNLRSSAGIVVTPDTAVRFAPVFSCVRVLAESVGQLPCNLYKQTDKTREIVVRHPVHRVLRIEPNAFQTSQEFWEMCIAHLCLAGNFYAFINRGVTGAGVRELLPLNPGAVTPKILTDGATVVYQVKFANGTEDVLSADKVLHIRLFTLDGFRGVSPITYAMNSLGLGMAMERHAARLFENGASPGGVLQTEGELSPDAYERIRESWEARHRGSENAHRVAILEQGLKWVQVGLSNEDAQMLESRKLSREEVCGLFRVPPSFIADLERSTFNNSEQQARIFVDYTLMPYLTRIESRIRKQLLTGSQQDAYFAKFTVQALLRGDMKARAAFYTQQIQNGAISPNEIRELEDMNPRDGGDIYLTPLNMAINGEPPPSPTHLPDEGEPDDSQPETP